MAQRFRTGASRIIATGQEHSMSLMFFPLILLIFVGIISNNFVASGIQTTPTFTGYPCILGTGNCSLIASAVPNGCAADIQNCNSSAITTISFLDADSPFTQLIQGNIIGFFGSIFSSNNKQGGGNSLTQLNFCTANQGSGQTITSFYCQSGSGYGCFIFPDSTTLFYNATSNAGNSSNWSIEGDAFNPNDCNFVKIPAERAYALQYGYYDVFNATYYTLHFQTLSSTTVSLPNTFSIIGFLFGIVLLLGGLGLTIALAVLGSGTTIGINQQGTKMMQIIGIALIVWIFIFSEFGGWLSVFTLGIGTIIYILLTAMYFVGIYWRLFSYN